MTAPGSPAPDRPVAERLVIAAGPPPVVAVPSVVLTRLPVYRDARGTLAFAEYDAHLPFVPHRYFVMLDVPAGSLRGDHAHRACHQFLTCLRGSCTVGLDNGRTRDEVVLDAPTLGLHAPPLTWCTVKLDDPDTVLLVLASDPYDAGDYIHDYDEFRRLVTAP